MDEGTDSSINVGEICAQVMNFVMSKTNEKRTILEKVPQSELNKMSSKERRLHNESVKKKLKGKKETDFDIGIDYFIVRII